MSGTIAIALVVTGWCLGVFGGLWLTTHDHEHGAVLLWRCAVVIVLAGCLIGISS